jgi:hypothetical protein
MQGMLSRNAPLQNEARSHAPADPGKGCRRNGQRGAGRLKTLVWLVIFGAFIYASIKVVPVLFSEYQFQDAMQNAARFASVNRMQTLEDIRKGLMQEAQRQDIPINPEDIHITSESGVVTISAEYSVTVDLRVYQWTMNFHPTAGNKPLV